MSNKLVIEVDLETGEFTKKLDDIPRHVESTASKVSKAWGAASMALGTVAVNSAADFEAAMANVATVLDKKAGVSLDELKKGILALPPELGKATDLAAGMYQALSSGIEANKAVAFTAEAAKLAGAGLADMGSTVKALTGFVNAYGASSKSAQEVSDMMFRTVQLGVVELPELAAGLGNIASTAAAAKVSQQDLLAAIAATTVKGVPAAQAMTGLKAALANLIEPQEKALEAAEALGLKGFGPSMLAAEGFSGTIEKIALATGGNADKINALFGSVEAGGVVAALAAEKGQAYKTTLEQMGNSAGATQAAFMTQSDTFNKKMESLKASLDKLFIAFGEEYLPAIKKAIDTLTSNLEGLKVLAEAVMLPVTAAINLGQGIGKQVGTSAAVAGTLAAGDFSGASKIANAAMAQENERKANQSTLGSMGENFLNAMPGGQLLNMAFGGFRAAGGPVSPGKAYVVGEKGPEIMVPGSAGAVIPNGGGIGALPGSAGLGGGPQDKFEILRLKARAAFHQGSMEGLNDGVKEGGTKAIGESGSKKSSGLAGMLASRSSEALVDGLLSGDVKGGIKDFAKGMAETAKNFLKQALLDALGKKIFKSLFSGGFGGFMAEGGPVTAGVPYIVGERRPEVFVPKTNGTILPRVPDGMGGGIHIQNLHLSAGPGPGGVQSIQDIERELAKIARAGQSSYFPRQIQAARS